MFLLFLVVFVIALTLKVRLPCALMPKPMTPTLMGVAFDMCNESVGVRREEEG